MNPVDRVPPWSLVLLAIISIQLGSALATRLFPIIGSEGTVALRILLSSLLLLVAAKGRVRSFARIFQQNWRLLLGYGMCIAAMNMFFYQSIARIPLGAAVAIEFVGPLGVAALGSRKPIHFLWVGLAAFGILLLSPLTGVELDELGILFALMAGLGWGMFIPLSRKVSNRVPENDGLAIGMSVAAISMLPFAIPVIPLATGDPLILLALVSLALLSTTIPFTLEFEALKKITARNYGILVSAEPAVAALLGAILLGERIGVPGIVAVACVVIAAIGITLGDSREAADLHNSG